MNDKARPRVFDAKSRWSWSSSVARASLRRTAWANPRKQVRSQVPTCRRKRKGIVSRLMVVLRSAATSSVAATFSSKILTQRVRARASATKTCAARGSNRARTAELRAALSAGPWCRLRTPAKSSRSAGPKSGCRSPDPENVTAEDARARLTVRNLWPLGSCDMEGGALGFVGDGDRESMMMWHGDVVAVVQVCPPLADTLHDGHWQLVRLPA